jgi:hypothetical protein
LAEEVVPLTPAGDVLGPEFGEYVWPLGFDDSLVRTFGEKLPRCKT